MVPVGMGCVGRVAAAAGRTAGALKSLKWIEQSRTIGRKSFLPVRVVVHCQPLTSQSMQDIQGGLSK